MGRRYCKGDIAGEHHRGRCLAINGIIVGERFRREMLLVDVLGGEVAL